MNAVDLVSCELCGLAHDPRARRCDGCDHALGTAPDYGALERESGVLTKRIALGSAAIVAMIALNLWLFSGAGVVLISAPFVWIIHSAVRYRAVKRYLARA